MRDADFWMSPGESAASATRYRPGLPLVREKLFTSSIDWRSELVGIVPEKTFAEVGGLWNTVHETVSIALTSGCREATEIDIQPIEHDLWRRFHDRCRERGVSGYNCVSGDICDDRFVADVGQFDVVFCSGVIYHCPHPLQAIHNLITIARERIVISSEAIPECIENASGTLRAPVGSCLFVPALGARQRAILREHPHPTMYNGMRFVPGRDERGLLREDGSFRYGPWWWLYTAYR